MKFSLLRSNYSTIFFCKKTDSVQENCENRNNVDPVHGVKVV